MSTDGADNDKEAYEQLHALRDERETLEQKLLAVAFKLTAQASTRGALLPEMLDDVQLTETWKVLANVEALTTLLIELQIVSPEQFMQHLIGALQRRLHAAVKRLDDAPRIVKPGTPH